jgi:hypothetical protein
MVIRILHVSSSSTPHGPYYASDPEAKNKIQVAFKVASTEGYCSIVQLLSCRASYDTNDLFESGMDRRPRETDYVNSHTVLLYIIAINTVRYNV